MNITEQQVIEGETRAVFSYIKPTATELATIGVDGPRAGVELALEMIKNCRDAVLENCRVRQGISLAAEEIISLRLPAAVASLDIQFANYRRWLASRSEYFKPSEKQIALMRAACQEGDFLISNFAHSFDIRRPDGSVIRVDRKGRTNEV